MINNEHNNDVIVYKLNDKEFFCETFRKITNPEYLTEVRIIKNAGGVINLFFDDIEKLYDAIVPHNGIHNIYWTINPISKEYFRPAAGGTKDEHISKRQYILIDIDTVRDKDTSATDEQLEESKKVAEEVVKHFDRIENIIVMSGNGYHILLKCDILNDALNTMRVRNFLEAVSRKFSNDFCRIDTSVYNASRIVRIPYTINVKGNIHREAVIVSVKRGKILLSMSLDLFCGTENEEKNNTIKTSFEETDFFDALSKCKKQIQDAYKSGKPLNVRGGEGRKLTLNILGELKINGLKSPHFACRWLFGKDYNADITEREWKYIKPIPMSSENVKKFFPNSFSDAQKKGLKRYNQTDVGNSKRLVALHGEDIRFCGAWKKWFVWKRTMWVVDENNEIIRKAKDMVQKMYIEGGSIDNEHDRKKFIGHALRSEQKERIFAAVKLAEDEVPIKIKMLDTNQMLFNVANGTIDLHTCELMQHRREDFITKITEVEYDSKAECPRWLLFLNEIMDGNEEMVSFLQRAVGMSLTGKNEEHVLFILYGTGRNGKSTFLNILLKLFGDYGMQASSDLLMMKKHTGHTTDIADLFGRRFVSLIESAENQKFNEIIIKNLTGGDKIRARRLYENNWEFWPTHKLWFATNYKPRVKGTDLAIWSRLKMIEFKVTFSDENQDKGLMKKLEAELSGILKWAMYGCLEYQTKGLQIPETVKRATEIYKKEQDILSDFLSDTCYINKEVSVRGKDLYTKYESWCIECGEKKTSKRYFFGKLEERGFIKQIGGKNILYFKGLELINNEQRDLRVSQG